MSARFTPDGASVLVLERRPPAGGSEKGLGVVAVSRRPIAGGPARDLVASDAVVIAMAPLGDGAAVLNRPSTAEEKGAPRDPDDDRDSYFDGYIAAIEKTALYRVSDGAAPVRVSPEGRRVLHMVGAAQGQWVAYSLAPEGKRRYLPRRDAGVEETRVLGAKPGEEITLTIKGLVRDISPDGARLLLRRAPAEGSKPPRPRETPPPRDDARSLVIVTVKDQVAADLPTRLQVDGAEVDVATFLVGFAGDGLLFRSPKGELYRSALDGSGAVRLAGPLREGETGLSGADEDERDDDAEEASPPVERERRILGPGGALFELREEPGAVVLSSLAKPGAPEPLARFEGPLRSLGAVAFDPAGKRLALSVLSDSSRDGAFDANQDDAEVFVTGDQLDPAAIPTSFGRGPVALRGDELRPRIAAAAGIPESAVTAEVRRGSLKVTAELPWNESEDARALIDRVFVAARAIAAAAPRKETDDVSLHVRVGPLDLAVIDRDDGGVPHHLVLAGQGLHMADPAALPLVHRKPAGLTSWGFGGNVVTLSGELVNSGKEATPPIEVYTIATSGYGDERKRTRLAKQLGSVAPGASAKYTLTVTDYNYGNEPHASFLAEGKHLSVFNEYSGEHCLHALAAALEMRSRHGVWFEHKEVLFGGLHFLIRLTADQAALADAPREALFRTLLASVGEHRSKYHKDSGVHLVLAAPGGGGWSLEMGKKAVRFEGPAEAQMKK